MTIAVVIPALDEAEEIAGAIESASHRDRDRAERSAALRAGGDREEPSSAPTPTDPDSSGAPPVGVCLERSDGIEIVVVDGGSGDDTIERAQAAGARTLSSPRGRSRQLQAGVDATTSEVVLFLHADSRLPWGWEKAVRDALADPETVGGAFRFRLRGSGAWLRLMEWGVRLRVAIFALPYGDQGIFVRRSVLAALGGVPQVALMEDLDLVHAMKSHGRLALLAPPVTTSERRYQRAGMLRTVALHWLAATAWRLGVDREVVAGWVRR